MTNQTSLGLTTISDLVTYVHSRFGERADEFATEANVRAWHMRQGLRYEEYTAEHLDGLFSELVALPEPDVE